MVLSDVRSTIFALSSGRLPAAIAVVRICGPNAGVALERLIGRLPQPRQATLARVREPASGEAIDDALALWFPGPHSETGEDMAELQLHGGRAVVAAVLDALGAIEGCRLAEPGEFTRRAFDNARLDLTEVEGLADLIAAETSAQRRQGYRQLKGLIGDRAEAWRRQIIEALALVEARIDFSDEADVPEDLDRSCALCCAAIAQHNCCGPGGWWARGAVTGRSRRCHCRTAECRQIDAAESPRPARGRDRLALPRHHPRRHRSASGSRRLSGDAGRYGRHPRQRRSSRAGRRPPRVRAGGSCRSSALGH